MFHIELASFDAWPALESQDFEGWRLQFARGYTKRANCASAVKPQGSLIEAQLRYVEDWFSQRGQPPIFRLSSFAVSEQIDSELRERNYALVEPSLVMINANQTLGSGTMSIAQVIPNCETHLDVEAEVWVKAYQAITGRQGVGQVTHLEMLGAIRGQPIFGVIYQEGQPLCCGLAVRVGELLGFFDIATAPPQRRRGLAQMLCQALANRGTALGARQAFLQVLETNDRAIKLYEKLGFTSGYRYWYRVKTDH